MIGRIPVAFVAGLVSFLAPGLLSGARRSRSNVLLGGAFGVCAAPCIGPVLASTLALASNTSTVAQGSVLLLAYSAGLALPFLVTGVAFSQAMSAFRWLRDRYHAIQIVSGATLVALGLLLFFDRFWWLRVGLNRALGAYGPSRRSAFSSWRSQPTRFPRPAWYHATATWTSPW